MNTERIVILGLLALLAASLFLLFRTRSKLAAARARLETMAVTDETTGAYNRRHLFERFEEEFQEHRRQGTEMSCILVDLDRLRSVNEKYGHRTGDAVLKEFARITRGCIRVYDILGRTGGEEFMILLPLTGLLQAMAFAERIRKTIERDFAREGAERGARRTDHQPGGIQFPGGGCVHRGRCQAGGRSPAQGQGKRPEPGRAGLNLAVR